MLLLEGALLMGLPMFGLIKYFDPETTTQRLLIIMAILEACALYFDVGLNTFDYLEELAERIDKALTKYVHSFLPYRWIPMVIFIGCMSVLIAAGFALKQRGPSFFIGEQYMWQTGNVVFWIIIDLIGGIGRRSPILK